MRPRRFYIFFPPAIAKRVRNGIEYGIGAIPLGGYVKIPGMHRPAAGDLEGQLERALDEAPWLERYVPPVRDSLGADRLDEAATRLERLRAVVARAELSDGARRSAERGLVDLADALSADAYWRAPAWKKIAVIVAGPATNLVFAIGLLAAVFALGVPVEVSRTVAQVSPGTPAAAAGLRAGDEVVAIDGNPVTPETISARIRASAGRPITVGVRRGGDTRTLGPARAARADGVYRLGFELASMYRSYGPLESVELAARDAWRVTELTGQTLARLVTGEDRENVSSAVGIVQGSSQALDELGVRVYLRILAVISLSLALLNLLPLLPLDGGHIAFSIVEAVRGRAIPRVAYERFSAIGIALVLMLFLLGLSNDVNRLSS
ncbi:MAG: site-2 protease family protein [Thermoleophilia bacterium]|nr:site-2 protease family protein [Thermoleophilia bacterium]